MIQRRDFFGNANRVMSGHGIAHDSSLHAFAMLTDEKTEHTRMVVRLEALDLQMVLGLTITLKTKLVGELNVTFHLFQETLVQLRPLARHALLNFLPASNDPGLHQVEFHCIPRPYLASVGKQGGH
jgi:hypothetical protein